MEKKLDNSYSNVIQADNGRIYTVFGVNLYNITKLPSGTVIPRTDELGVFAMRWSDDGGATWSTNMTVLPYRNTAIDNSNDFAGKVDLFWNVDQFKVRNNTAYFMFTKIAHWLYVRGGSKGIGWGVESPVFNIPLTPPRRIRRRKVS